MKGFLKGYYGYKNFGDEVLLLGIVPYIFTHYDIDYLYIEGGDPERLRVWRDRHASLLTAYATKVEFIAKHTASRYARDHLFLGGGEVLTDGRPFPYNGWNYLLQYRKHILFGRFHLLGGIGTPQKTTSRRLRYWLLKKATTVVTREQRSFDVVASFRSNKPVVAYHDFAEDVFLPLVKKIQPPVAEKTNTLLMNTNPYIWSEETKQKLFSAAQPYDQVLYFPAEIGVDDQFVETLRAHLPHITCYDWTEKDIETICRDISCCQAAIAARLHVLWLAKLFHLPFTPLVYQEKISTFLNQCSGDSSGV